MRDLLAGVRVVDATGEPAAMAGRILADLGADVIKVGDPAGDQWRRTAWDRDCERVGAATPELLASAHVVLETPGWPGVPILDPADAPHAVWVFVTPFGLTGPRSGWTATDLGVMAASGNMHATGDPDRPPVRPSEPVSYAHVGPEVAFAALTGLATGGPRRIDLSMQETVLAANMCGPAPVPVLDGGLAARERDPAPRSGAWADAVVENFAPKAMKGSGLDDETLFEVRPDLVVVHSCLNGQTGPHRDYPGFGGQGAALSGWNFVTGWPDREPLGPFGTITDSLAPRFVATALAAGLLHQRRSDAGISIDVSQVECGVYALSPWLLRFRHEGVTGERAGNAAGGAILHGVFPCEGDDRWVAIACWSDEEWNLLAELAGITEEALAEWTAKRSPDEAAEALQAFGVEAVPVQNFGDLLEDPQLAHRQHFVTLDHPVMGPGPYERNGFRLSDALGGYEQAGPTLGEHTREVLRDFLGLSDEEIDTFAQVGALS